MEALVNIMRRMAAATGSPHYGGIDPEEVDAAGFSLPGGGMSCEIDHNRITIDICSLGGVVRLRAAIDAHGQLVRPSNLGMLGLAYGANRTPNGDTTSSWTGWYDPVLYYGYEPRERDWQRLDGWIAVARGETHRIPWHGRPQDATDDPLSVAIAVYRHFRRFGGIMPLNVREILRAVGVGPRVHKLAFQLVMRTVKVQDEMIALLDAALEDAANGETFEYQYQY